MSDSRTPCIYALTKRKALTFFVKKLNKCWEKNNVYYSAVWCTAAVRNVPYSYS